MDAFTVLPDVSLNRSGPVSREFADPGIKSFHPDCGYVHEMPYGYNSDRDDVMILFREGYGSCTTKNAVIATLARELALYVHKMIGIYRMTDSLVTGTAAILSKYDLPYVPMVHCFLAYDEFRVDLTEGNDNGKNGPVDEFLVTKQIGPDITEKDEYLLYRDALENDILNRPEMSGIETRTVLRTRSEGIVLLRSKVSH